MLFSCLFLQVERWLPVAFGPTPWVGKGVRCLHGLRRHDPRPLETLRRAAPARSRPWRCIPMQRHTHGIGVWGRLCRQAFDPLISLYGKRTFSGTAGPAGCTCTSTSLPPSTLPITISARSCACSRGEKLYGPRLVETSLYVFILSTTVLPSNVPVSLTAFVHTSSQAWTGSALGTTIDFPRSPGGGQDLVDAGARIFLHRALHGAVEVTQVALAVQRAVRLVRQLGAFQYLTRFKREGAQIEFIEVFGWVCHRARLRSQYKIAWRSAGRTIRMAVKVSNLIYRCLDKYVTTLMSAQAPFIPGFPGGHECCLALARYIGTGACRGSNSLQPRHACSARLSPNRCATLHQEVAPNRPGVLADSLLRLKCPVASSVAN